MQAWIPAFAGMTAEVGLIYENHIRRPGSFRKEAKARGKVLLARKLRNQPVSSPGHR